MKKGKLTNKDNYFGPKVFISHYIHHVKCAQMLLTSLPLL